MKLRAPLSLAAIILAGTLASCSAGNNEDNGNQVDGKVTAQSTANPSAGPTNTPDASSIPEIPIEADPVESAAPESDEAPAPVAPAVPAKPVEPEKLELPAEAALGEVEDGQTKTDMTYVAEKLKAHIAAHGKPKTDNWLEAIAADTPDWNGATDIGFSLSDDGTWSLHGWNPNDPNYKDFNTALEYHSVEGFIAP